MSLAPPSTTGMASPSIVAFGSQITWPSSEYLFQLRAALLLESRLGSFILAIKGLPAVWRDFVNHDPRLSAVPGQACSEELVEWVNHGEFRSPTGSFPNILTMPFTIIIHITQYLCYLDSLQSSQVEILKHVRDGGVQGFCTGMLTATAVACSESEEDVNTFGAVALRLALCIGAYVDLDGAFAGETNETASIAVRWRSEAGHDRILETLKGYSNAYISVLYDSTDVTLTCQKSSVAALTQQLSSQGMTVKSTGLEGRYHSSVHAEALASIFAFCDSRPDFAFPPAERLLLPLRSNSTAQVLMEGSLHEHALRCILTDLADWHLTISAAVSPLIRVKEPVAACFGLIDFIPSSVIRESGLKVNKMKNSKLFPSKLAGPESAHPSGAITAEVPAPQDGRYPDHAIAVIGMACKFPGADSVEEFWHLLTAGTSMCEEMPEMRFSAKGLRRSQDGKLKFWGNFLRDVDAFDHKFFKKSSREAATMDPQQRLLLEVAYQAVESSGYFGDLLHTITDDIGCYLGACSNDYNDNVASHPPNAFSSLGTLHAFLSGKISHYFGWTGPSVVYDTACSSSAVAIHQACNALILGECSQALAGGVSVYTNPNFYQNLAAASFLSPTGPTKPFDAKGDGYCRGEGAGLVMLKKLSRALADEDDILGVISGSAVNQNSNSTNITVPHSPSQISLYKKISKLSGIDPVHVSFVEAHGTGTPVGDPVEFASIRDVFAGPHRANPLHVASVKGNIGHLEGASGVAALIKTLLMMQYKTLPIQANYSSLNPKIPALEPDRLAIPTSTQEWKTDFQVACINNYGAAGSNAALMLCQPPGVAAEYSQFKATTSTRTPIIVSAHSEEGLRTYCIALQNSIASLADSSESLSCLAFNLSHKQNRSLSYSVATTVSSLTELRSQLSSIKSGAMRPQHSARAKPVVLCFGGQVSNTVGLNKALYDASALLRLHLDGCDIVLRSLGLEGLYPKIFHTVPIEDPVTLHGLLFSLQYSCARSWIDAGMKIHALVGHSFGQLTALCVSGTISLSDGLKLVTGRASLMKKYWGPEPGSMISIEADLGTVLNYLSSSQGVEIACYNGPTSHVLVGVGPAIDRLQTELAGAGVKHKRLNVTNGFHSTLTEPLLPALQGLAEQLTYSQPTIELQTCTRDRSIAFGPEEIKSHTRTPVYFGQAVERLAQSLGPSTWLEAGSNSSVASMARRALDASTVSSHTFQALNLGGADAVGTLADATVNLWKAGHHVHFWPFHRSQRHDYRAINLPPYQFEKSRHWLSWVDTAQIPAAVEPAKPVVPRERVLLSLTKFRDQNQREAEFAVDPHSEDYRFYVEGHAVLAEPLCPAPLYVELVSRAAMILTSDAGGSGFVPCVEDLEIMAPLGINDRVITIVLKRGDSNPPAYTFELASKAEGDAKGSTHATGRVSLHQESARLLTDFARYERLIRYNKFDEIRNDPDSEIVQGAMIYKAFSRVVIYRPHYKGVRSICGRGQEVVGVVSLPSCDHSALQFNVTNPLAVDNFIQIAGLHVNCLNECKDSEVFVCTKVERIQPTFNFKESKAWIIYSSFTSIGDREIVNDVFVFDRETKRLVLMVLGAHFMRVTISSLTKVLSRANDANSAAVDPAAKAFTQTHVAPSALPATRDPILLSASKKAKKSAKRKVADDAVTVVDMDVKKLLNQVTDVPIENFNDDSTLDELGIDSLMITEVMGEICKFFKMDISAADFANLSDVKSLRGYLVARGCGGGTKSHTPDPSSQSESDDSSVTSPAMTAATSTDDIAGLPADLQTDLAKLVAVHLETDMLMSREINLANEGLDSLLSIELATDIKRNFGATVDMSLLDGDSTFGDLLDMVTAQTHTSLPIVKAKIASTVPANTDVSIDHPQPLRREVPASLLNGQQAFEDIRFDYDVHTKRTGFFDFWRKVYPTQARLVLAYTVEAFAILGCQLASLKPGQRLPRVQTLPKHDLLMDQLYEILKDGSLVDSSGAELLRSSTPMDPTHSSTLFREILNAHPQHASEHKLLNITGSKLAECLTGTADPLQLLFRSKENKELLEDVYTNGPMYEAITKLLASFLDVAYKMTEGGSTFHILELGGGTGGTTKYIVDFLSRQNVSFTYTFTDLSGSLVTAARKKFAGRSNMEFQLLDVEKTPPEKFLGKYHTIISTNCIHATRNLQLSSTNIRQMLRLDGFVSLVEFTRNIYWFDLVFGLLEGWWLYEDGRKHVLASENFWDRSMRAAGFRHVTWTDGNSEEARTLRIITGFNAEAEKDSFRPTKKVFRRPKVETVVWKQAGPTTLHADVYIPREIRLGEKRPIALLIHSGGHVLFTRKEVDLKQISILHADGFLPVSVDYRLCPELNIINGPMNDVAEALRWSRFQLPSLAPNLAHDLQADGEKVVAVGWSAGGTLAMTAAFTAPQRGLRAPEAILAFYCPTDYEDDWWKSPIYPSASVSNPSEAYDLLEGIQKDPIANYYPAININHPGMVMSLSDPRWRFVLHMNWRAQTTSFLRNPPSPNSASTTHEEQPPPTQAQIASISPYAQILENNYRTPTFLIHGRQDDMIPYQQSVKTVEALKAQGIESHCEIVEGAKHLFDTFPEIGVDFEPSVRRAYEWLAAQVNT